MKLLAIDTSTNSCSVALLDGERVLAETLYTAGKTHAVHLMPMIAHVLDHCGCAPVEIEAIGVTRGPGTFTGLRIGISTAKGLGSASRAALIGVNSLTALAYPLARLTCPVIALIDARRKEVYWSQYRSGEAGFEMVSPVSLASPETVANRLPKDSLLVGSGALLYRSVFESRCPGIRFADSAQHVIRGSSVGLLAFERFSRHDVDPLDTMVPEYIRKSDAQIQMTGTC